MPLPLVVFKIYKGDRGNWGGWRTGGRTYKDESWLSALQLREVNPKEWKMQAPRPGWEKQKQGKAKERMILLRGGVLFFSETCCTVGLCLLFLAQIAIANYIAYQMWFVRLNKETTARTCFPCCLHPVASLAQIRFLMLYMNKVKTPVVLFWQ